MHIFYSGKTKISIPGRSNENHMNLIRDTTLELKQNCLLFELFLQKV